MALMRRLTRLLTGLTGGKETAHTTQAERSFRFHYKTIVPASFSSEEAVDVWIPVASTDEQQEIGPLQVDATIAFEEGVDPIHRNRMIHARVPKGSPGVTIDTSFDVRRRRWQVPRPEPSEGYGEEIAREYASYLAADTKVPTDGVIVDPVWKVVGRADPPVTRARKLFEHLMRTLDYDGAGCTPDRVDKLGDLNVACDLERGTCTEFHGLYVAYCRTAGIPARFRFGFNVPFDAEEGTIAGYHCWSEILLPKVGWFPVDVTEAMKEQARGRSGELFFGGLNCHRVQLSTGRDVWLEPRQASGPVDKFIFSHGSRGAEDLHPIVSFRFALPGG